MSFIVNKKNGPQGLLLIITDKEIINKKFSENNLKLDLSKEFYQGEEKTKDEINLTEARDLHFTGKEAVAFGVEKGLIDPKRILYIENIPHAEVAITD